MRDKAGRDSRLTLLLVLSIAWTAVIWGHSLMSGPVSGAESSFVVSLARPLFEALGSASSRTSASTPSSACSRAFSALASTTWRRLARQSSQASSGPSSRPSSTSASSASCPADPASPPTSSSTSRASFSAPSSPLPPPAPPPPAAAPRASGPAAPGRPHVTEPITLPRQPRLRGRVRLQCSHHGGHGPHTSLKRRKQWHIPSQGETSSGSPAPRARRPSPPPSSRAAHAPRWTTT